MVMSTGCNNQSAGSVLRKEKDGRRVEVPCPSSVILYNEHIGGVDRGDQKRGYYNCRTKSRKFYKYIFYFLLDVAITDTHILLSQYTGYTATIKDFRIHLAKLLIGDYCSRRRPGRGGGLTRSLSLRHFSAKIQHAEGKGYKRGRCAHCNVANKRADVPWWCQECRVWLCHTGISETDCFLSWHASLTEN